MAILFFWWISLHNQSCKNLCNYHHKIQNKDFMQPNCTTFFCMYRSHTKECMYLEHNHVSGNHTLLLSLHSLQIWHSWNSATMLIFFILASAAPECLWESFNLHVSIAIHFNMYQYFVPFSILSSIPLCEYTNWFTLPLVKYIWVAFSFYILWIKPLTFIDRF